MGQGTGASPSRTNIREYERHATTTRSNARAPAETMTRHATQTCGHGAPFARTGRLLSERHTTSFEQQFRAKSISGAKRTPFLYTVLHLNLAAGQNQQRPRTLRVSSLKKSAVLPPRCWKWPGWPPLRKRHARWIYRTTYLEPTSPGIQQIRVQADTPSRDFVLVSRCASRQQELSAHTCFLPS